VKKGLSDITSEQLKYVIIAYEPIWAIGTGLIASNDTINQVCGYIKEILKNLYGAVGKKVIVVYGGSVKSSSSHDILNLSNVDGVLVGGGSLDPNEFYKIAKSI
jgi:triosephosphate isomerase